MKRSCLMWILWPSFLFAGAGSAVLFALVDPLDLVILGSLSVSRNFAYAAGFFLFWIVSALSSALSLYLAGLSCPDEWSNE